MSTNLTSKQLARLDQIHAARSAILDAALADRGLSQQLAEQGEALFCAHTANTFGAAPPDETAALLALAIARLLKVREARRGE